MFWDGAFFAEIGKETRHLGIKIAGVSGKIWQFCMILKKLQFGMGPVSGPSETHYKVNEMKHYFEPFNSKYMAGCQQPFLVQNGW